MAEFTWTSTSNTGAKWTASGFPSFHKIPWNKYLNGDYIQKTSDELFLNNGRISVYVNGGYTFEAEYKNFELLRNSAYNQIYSFNAESLVIKQGESIIFHSLYEGYFLVENDWWWGNDLSGYITKATWTYPTEGTKLTVTGRYDYASDFAGSSLSTIFKLSSRGNDTFNGTNNTDRIDGYLGNDVIFGKGGDDFLWGFSGNDKLYGGDGADRLYGGSGNDYINGGDGADSLHGGTGGDSLIAGKGSDYINGGSGTDGVWFGGDFNDYIIRGTSNNLTISDKISGENNGTNSLFSIEILNFRDKKRLLVNQIFKTYSGNFRDYKFFNKGNGIYQIKTDFGYDEITGFNVLTFTGEPTRSAVRDISAMDDIKGTFDQITGLNTDSGKMFRLYNAAFGRFPDPDGLRHWIGELSSGRKSLGVVAESFLESREFKVRYGEDLSESTYVNTLYQNVLDRDPDVVGFNHWVGQINSGEKTRYEVLIGLTESIENKRQFTEMTGFDLF